MILEIGEIIHRVGHQATVVIEEAGPTGSDLVCVAPVHGRLTLTNTGQFLLVRGELATVARVECVRCLKEVSVAIGARVEEEFPLPRIDVRGTVHWDVEGEPTPILEGYTLDAGELARQYLSLALPTAPVCDEGCRGFCPTCGANLNEGVCGCLPAEGDERLSVLRVLLEETDSPD